MQNLGLPCGTSLRPISPSPTLSLAHHALPRGWYSSGTPARNMAYGDTFPRTKPRPENWHGAPIPFPAILHVDSSPKPLRTPQKRGRESGGLQVAAARHGTPSFTIPLSILFTPEQETARPGIVRCEAKATVTICIWPPFWLFTPAPASSSGISR